jgi:hypothetical protein
VQELLGHKDVSTTMIETPVMKWGSMGTKGAVDTQGGRLTKIDLVTGEDIC